MSDHDTERWVLEELHWDPKLDSKAIAVSADDGEVTLRGTVGSFHEKRDAAHAARRVVGVKTVKNHLDVRPLGKHGRDDADLRGAVLRALELDGLIPNTIDARVDDARVTLTGTAAWQYQRQEAEYVAGNVRGVLEVENEIRLENAPSDSDATEAIRKAFNRNAKLAVDSLSVDARDGAVVLSGTVKSWEEHDAAIAVAWAGPGVTQVHDHLEVYPEK